MSAAERTYLQTPEQWTRFLSSLVHELRTPLASLRMLSELLAGSLQGRVGDSDARYIQNMQEVIGEVQELIGDVAELARLVAGRAQVRPSDVSPGEIVEQVKEAMRPRTWERDIALTDSLDPTLPSRFPTDPERLRQVLILLLASAVGRAASEVSLRLELDEENLGVSVSWDGPPFAEQSLDTLFEPFDGGGRPARQRLGQGLALTLASELARALGGSLRAGNRAGQPTFDLSLPAAAS